MICTFVELRADTGDHSACFASQSFPISAQTYCVHRHVQHIVGHTGLRRRQPQIRAEHRLVQRFAVHFERHAGSHFDLELSGSPTSGHQQCGQRVILQAAAEYLLNGILPFISNASPADGAYLKRGRASHAFYVWRHSERIVDVRRFGRMECLPADWRAKRADVTAAQRPHAGSVVSAGTVNPQFKKYCHTKRFPPQHQFVGLHVNQAGHGKRMRLERVHQQRISITGALSPAPPQISNHKWELHPQCGHIDVYLFGSRNTVKTLHRTSTQPKQPANGDRTNSYRSATS